jgi:HlyD family secretion protein
LDQDATVTLDAIASEKFAAKVTHISQIGNAEGSITTFAVELTLSSDARFLEGMNGNATILVDQADNVLIIPVEAINEDSSGAFVYVGSSREKTYITTGLSDGEYAEVASGLSEGDVVQYIGSSTESTMDSFGMQNPFGGSSSGGEETDGN